MPLSSTTMSKQELSSNSSNTKRILFPDLVEQTSDDPLRKRPRTIDELSNLDLSASNLSPVLSTVPPLQSAGSMSVETTPCNEVSFMSHEDDFDNNNDEVKAWWLQKLPPSVPLPDEEAEQVDAEGCVIQRCHACYRSYKVVEEESIIINVAPSSTLLSYFTPTKCKTKDVIVPNAPIKRVKRHDLCTYCERDTCDGCLQSCHDCHDKFCPFCCTIDYVTQSSVSRYEEVVCFSCSIRGKREHSGCKAVSKMHIDD